MKKIVIENFKFDYDIGVRLLKLRYADCQFEELKDIWNDIEPLSFKEIAMFSNLEERRIGIMCLGLERLVSQVNPTLVDTKSIKKETTWVNDKGELEHIKFTDKYELYKVDKKYFAVGLVGWRANNVDDVYYVKCKDTSTDREYFIWVDINDVYRTNEKNRSSLPIDIEKKVNAIQAIAWTIQTNIPKGKIEKIVRQGDCILIKPKDNDTGVVRHLTEKEYRELLVAES